MTDILRITLPTPDGPMPTVLAGGTLSSRGAVLVLQEGFGVTPHLENECRRLAEAGWYAVAPAFFHRQGAPVFAYDNLPAIGPVMNELSAAGIDQDLQASVDYLDRVGFGAKSRAVIGFCLGGQLGFYAATKFDFGVSVSFYGDTRARFGLPSLVDLASGLRCPWLGLYGDQDQYIPVEEMEHLRQAVEGGPHRTELVIYPGPKHGFNNDDRPGVFAPEAAADGRKRTEEWLSTYIEPA